MGIEGKESSLGIKLRFFWLFVFFCVLFSSASFAKNAGKELKEIQQSCETIDAGFKNNALSPQYFAALSAGQPDLWRKFPTEGDFQAACSKGFFRKAAVYFKGSLPQFISLEFKSPSKEWVHFLKCYFREDGTLEKIHSDFRRFGAYERSKGMEQQFLVKVLRDRFYSQEGKCIKKSAPRFFNTDNGQEVKDVVFTDVSWPSYMRVEKLPFYSLIQPPSTPTPIKP